MKTLLIAAIAGVFLFAGSATVSWYLMNQQEQIAAEKQDSEGAMDELDPASKLPPVVAAVEKTDQMPVGLRPNAPITVESVMELSRSIRKTEQQLVAREQKLQQDEAGIELSFADLKRERDELSAFSNQIESKIRKYRELVEQLKIENSKLETTKKQIENDRTAVAASTDAKLSGEMAQRVSVAKKYLTEMDDDTVATLLKQSVNTGDVIFASEVLKSLDERKGGKVLEALQDPALVDQLLRKAGISQ